MTSQDILRLRLSNEQLSRQTFSAPAEVVSWLGAVQSQDYASAKWALGQRLPNAADRTIEEAFTNGEILRTHVMRPTWHFVTPQDIRWILQLTAYRVKAIMAYYNRQLGLTDEIFRQSNATIVKTLQGNKQLTRNELAVALQHVGLPSKGQALGHLAMQAELDAVICSGPRKGKQFTYMLLDERAAKTKPLTDEEALAELVKRYFTSHGPATTRDFTWWSGLTVADTNKGIKLLGSTLIHEVTDGKTYYFVPQKATSMPVSAYLLPNYDEYTIAYKDRDDYYTPPEKPIISRDNVPFSHAIIIHGKIVGMWKRIVQKNLLIIEPRFFSKPSTQEYQAVKQAARRYGAFLGLNIKIT